MVPLCRRGWPRDRLPGRSAGRLDRSRPGERDLQLQFHDVRIPLLEWRRIDWRHGHERRATAARAPAPEPLEAAPAAPAPEARSSMEATSSASSLAPRMLDPTAMADPRAGCAGQGPTSAINTATSATASSARPTPTARTKLFPPMTHSARAAISVRAFRATRTSASNASQTPTAPAIPRAICAASTRPTRRPRRRFPSSSEASKAVAGS